MRLIIRIFFDEAKNGTDFARESGGVLAEFWLGFLSSKSSALDFIAQKSTNDVICVLQLLESPQLFQNTQQVFVLMHGVSGKIRPVFGPYMVIKKKHSYIIISKFLYIAMFF